MKKSLLTIALALILTFTMAFSALAASYEHIADELNVLGLFQGTDAGYDLDRAPTRAEAVTMLVRFLGLEEEALAEQYEHPFDDSRGWMSPFIGIAYEKGLTTGTSATTFNPGGVCNAQMYVTFILRALGYSDAADGDFAYADAILYGKSIGVIDDILASGTFLRDEMVVVSYLALVTAPKDSEFSTLLEKLVVEGAVTQSAAAGAAAKLKLLEEFAVLNSSLDNETNFEMVMKMDIDLGALGGGEASMELNMIIGDNFDILASIIMDISIIAMETPFLETSMEMYIADGFVYINADGEKIKVDAGLADLDLDAILGMAEMGEFAETPLYAISSIKKSTSGTLTVYEVEFAEGFMDAVMAMAMGMMDIADLGLQEMEDMNLKISGMKFYADPNGNLRTIAMDMSMMVDVGIGPLPVNISMEIDIMLVGAAVKVTLPDDLGEYELVG